MKLNEAEKLLRIAAIMTEIDSLGRELLDLVAPTQKELKDLCEDTDMNPDIYMNYLVDDPIFVAENVYHEREARNEEKENG